MRMEELSRMHEMRTDNDKVNTGISGLDDLLEGGLIKRASVLLRGNAGTGKTIFAMHYLVHGANNSEPGVLLSMEETKKDLYREGAKFGWDLEALEEENRLAIIERQASYGKTIHELESIAHRINAKRAVIDSVPALFTSYPNELQVVEWRSAFNLLCQVLTENCGCTAILISEAGWSINFPFEEYVPKGVIELSDTMIEGRTRKFLLITKMRETRHSKSQHLYEITHKGFTLFQPYKFKKSGN